MRKEFGEGISFGVFKIDLRGVRENKSLRSGAGCMSKFLW